MIWGIVLGVAAVAVLVVLVARRYWARPQHGGGGEGALTVPYLVERVEAETSGGGRHQLHETVTIRGDLADALAVQEPRILPLPRELLSAELWELSRDLRVFHRVLAGVRRL
ncbi:hypothetical protein [Saccharopolyspora phatthalungensis]|uniref:Uncharacterized protein n=1 Tax=Saccharopolyspora phatthalungensis TaxID=664693 RepID=A0A840QAK9_9PSEU|nr:hypothetical protein [Saccharopolyspora phatthalungensis]MBB5155465.1 hypothetical protein [Saccharopolyspora phatthalungensis]